MAVQPIVFVAKDTKKQFTKKIIQIKPDRLMG